MQRRHEEDARERDAMRPASRFKMMQKMERARAKSAARGAMMSMLKDADVALPQDMRARRSVESAAYIRCYARYADRGCQRVVNIQHWMGPLIKAAATLGALPLTMPPPAPRAAVSCQRRHCFRHPTRRSMMPPMSALPLRAFAHDDSDSCRWRCPAQPPCWRQELLPRTYHARHAEVARHSLAR